MPVFEREEKVRTWGIDHVSGESAVDGEVLEHCSAGNDVVPHFASEYVVHSIGCVQLETLVDSLLELGPSADVVKRAEIVAACCGIGTVGEVLVASSAKTPETHATIEASGELQVRKEEQSRVESSCPGIKAAPERAEVRSEVSSDADMIAIIVGAISKQCNARFDTRFGALFRAARRRRRSLFPKARSQG